MNETFSARLRELRGKSSQVAFSALVGIKQTTLSAYERGAMEPTASNILLICDACGCTSDWLLGRDNTRHLPAQQINCDACPLAIAAKKFVSH